MTQGSTARYRAGSIDRSLLVLVAGIAVFFGVLATLPVPRAAGSDRLPAGRFAIVDALVFDGERFRPHHDVWVEDGRIHAVGQRLALPAALPRVDGRGRTVLPGLVDAHVHTFGTLLADSLRFGVTTVLDQFTAPAMARERRPARASIGHDGQADLFSAGMLATAPGGHGTQFGTPVETVRAPEDAAAWVAARKAEGSDWIKIVIEDGGLYDADLAPLDAATVHALVEAAHAEGLLAVAHVSRLADALRALEAGMDGLAHVWADAVISAEDAGRMAEAGLFVVPTLAVISSVAGAPASAGVSEAFDGAALSRMQHDSLGERYPIARPEDLTTALANVERLAAAGVRLLAGTDAPNPGTAAGVSLHAELRLLASAGLAPEAVLEAATRAPARAFGIEDRGALAEGQLADLVLLAGDLRDSVEHSVEIVAVWKDGEPVDRALPEAETAPAVTAAPAQTRVADFEDGTGARFGRGWYESTDSIRGGASEARLEAVDGALRITGEVRPGFAFPWAGAIWFPGGEPMAPVDFSDRERLSFRVRGDGRRYAVMVFGASVGTGVPPSAFFEAGPEWRTVSFPLETFGTGGVIAGVSIVAQAPAGPFELAVDDVTLE